VSDAQVDTPVGGKNLISGIMPGADALEILSSIPQEILMKMEQPLRGCVPAAIVNYLNIGKEFMGCENRSLTCMFANLGLDVSDCLIPEGRQFI
jgi:hypothetical protein